MKTQMIYLAGLFMLTATLTAFAQTQQPDWTKIEAETMRHFQAILRIDSSDPPGNEAPVVAYLKAALEQAGIETKIFALDPKRPNLVARLRGNGKKRPVLIMGTQRLWRTQRSGTHSRRGAAQICPLSVGHRGQFGPGPMTDEKVQQTFPFAADSQSNRSWIPQQTGKFAVPFPRKTS